MSRRVAASVGLLVVVPGVPLVLLEFTGAPGLGGLPDLEGIRRAIDLRWVPVEWGIRVLALLAWGLWAYLVFAVLLRVVAHLEVRLRGALRQAIDANPHSEYLYRRTMEIYGRLGRANDIRRMYSELEAALAEIEAEPDHETAELRRRLLDELRQKPTSA